MSATNTQSKLPQDADSVPIQTLAPIDSTAVTITLGTTQFPQNLPSGAEIVEVSATGNMRFSFGQAATNARVLPAGVYVYKVPIGITTFDAVAVDGSSGRCSVTRLI